jgi:signal transduction histidine kinase
VSDTSVGIATSQHSRDALLGEWRRRLSRAGIDCTLEDVATAVVDAFTGGAGRATFAVPPDTVPEAAAHELAALRATLLEGSPAGEAFRVHALVDDALVRCVAEPWQRLEQAYERALRDRDKVLSVVAHDLKNPLNTILLGTAVLESGAEPLPEGVRRGLGTITRGAQRLNRLIDDLIDLRAVQSGRLTLEAAACAPADLVDAAVAQAAGAAADKKLALETDVAPSLPAVLADRQRLVQALGNLIANAIRITPAGRVVVGARDAGEGGVALFVCDAGPGIAEAHIDQVFDAYWRAPGVPYTGTGLGLTIARGIARAHGGTLEGCNAPLGGARFTLTLPGGGVT